MKFLLTMNTQLQADDRELVRGMCEYVLEQDHESLDSVASALYVYGTQNGLGVQVAQMASMVSVLYKNGAAAEIKPVEAEA